MADTAPLPFEVPESGPQGPMAELPAATTKPEALRYRDRRELPRKARPRPSLESPLSQCVLPGAAPEPTWQTYARTARCRVEREAWPVVPWAQRETDWRKHATTAGFIRRLERAKSIAREGATKGRFYVALSGGKDSVALAGLMAEAGVSARGVYAGTSLDYPGVVETLDALGKAVGMTIDMLRPTDLGRHVERICKAYDRAKIRKRRGFAEYDEWDILRAVPADVCLLDDEPMGHVVKSFGHANMLTAHQYESGYAGSYNGVRRLESLARHFNWRKMGPLYQSKIDSLWTCTPIVEWSGKDVWAFITTRGLPWLPYYRLAYETGLSRRDPAQIRTGGLPYREIAEKGVLAPVARVFPAWWKTITSYRPELERYAHVEGVRL